MYLPLKLSIMDEYTYVPKTQLSKLKSLVRQFKNYEPQEISEKLKGDYSSLYVDSIFDKLDLLTKREDLHLIAFKNRPWEYETFLTFLDPQNPPVNNFKIHEERIFDNIKVPFTVNGLWQAYVLRDLWRTALPLCGHANYRRLEVYLEPKSAPDNSWGSCENDAYGKITEKYLPSIKLEEDNTATIKVALWNDWNGWIQAIIKVVWKDGKVIFNTPHTKIIAKYHCGVFF